MGNIEGKDAGTVAVETKIIEVQAGEIIVGVNIQEIGYYGNQGYPKGFNKQEGKDLDEFHLGSI